MLHFPILSQLYLDLLCLKFRRNHSYEESHLVFLDAGYWLLVKIKGCSVQCMVEEEEEE